MESRVSVPLGIECITEQSNQMSVERVVQTAAATRQITCLYDVGMAQAAAQSSLHDRHLLSPAASWTTEAAGIERQAAGCAQGGAGRQLHHLDGCRYAAPDCPVDYTERAGADDFMQLQLLLLLLLLLYERRQAAAG